MHSTLQKHMKVQPKPTRTVVERRELPGLWVLSMWAFAVIVFSVKVSQIDLLRLIKAVNAASEDRMINVRNPRE